MLCRGFGQAAQDVEQLASCFFVLAVNERVVWLVVVGQQALVATGFAQGFAVFVHFLGEF